VEVLYTAEGNRMGPRKPAERQEPVPTRLTVDDIGRGVAKLRKRIDEVRTLDPGTVRYNDQRVDNVEQNIRNSLLEVFGSTSPQFEQHGHHTIWQGGLVIGMSQEESQRRFAAGIPDTISLLENLIANLEEQRAEQQADPTSRVRTAFAGLDLHPRIRAVAEDLYRDGHYRNAILDSAVALVNYVKEKSRRHDLDGAALMRTVFSRNTPVLAFNNLADQTDQDEQEGLMHLFEGAVLAFRNPRAHDMAPDTPEYALECIGFLGMLVKKVDAAQRR
jgi:uncharacterized protein (TIGR02391 family)